MLMLCQLMLMLPSEWLTHSVALQALVPPPTGIGTHGGTSNVKKPDRPLLELDITDGQWLFFLLTNGLPTKGRQSCNKARLLQNSGSHANWS